MPLPASLAPVFYRFPPTAKGLASHAGVRHEDGHSAIHEMARQILRIEGKTNYARGITCNVGRVGGGTFCHLSLGSLRYDPKRLLAPFCDCR
jgi:Peptidase dimerisation domain